MNKFFSALILSYLLANISLSAQGNVYLIIGSDTAIWDVMDVSKHNCFYNYNIIPDNTRNFYKVMQPSYRNKFSDSYGSKLKLTWWMMGGNIFRYATNKNVPYPNVIVPYISEKYYGEFFTQFSDELSLHYHTFAWTDYDGDGKSWWNQAKNFNECKNDFYYTLAQMLLEENIFPGSFRSGWNYMDNEWQAELDKLFPYSMHNEAPGYHADNTEPTDNNYDWRLASKEFIPYRPSSHNYQLNGNGKGWNLHSRNVAGMTQAQMTDIFSKAQTKDQVVCLWGHVWDDLFPESVLNIDSLAKTAAIKYPNVKFKYCTGTEGMQLWRKVYDVTPPIAKLQEIVFGGEVKYLVQTDEQIFQAQPFVGLKLTNETYTVAEFIKTGTNEWISKNFYSKNNIAKAGLAVTDTLGNLTTQFINYVQDDIYIDNEDSGYSETSGNWITDNKASWGIDSRKSFLKVNDSSKVKWNFKITSPHNYNIFVQMPKTDQACKNVIFRIFSGSQLLDEITFQDSIARMDWIYLSTQYFNPSVNYYVEMVAKGTGQESRVLSADVIKITPLVRQKWLYTATRIVDFGLVIKNDTAKTNLGFSNNGTETLTITNITSKNNFVFTKSSFPITIPKFGRIVLPVYFCSSDLGKKADTLFVYSDDPFNPVVSISFMAEAANYFRIVDNEETADYKEFGVWAKSVAQAFGSSSRFANLNQSPKAYAVFTTNVADKGFYDVSFTVPKTVNASNKALYIIQQGNKLIDSLYIDQNYNSGNWITIKNCYLTNDSNVQIKVVDDGRSTVGAVLRTDAIKLSYTGSQSHAEEISNMPGEFKLFQNYPNPFNPSTSITYHLPRAGLVTLKIYNMLGEAIDSLVHEEQQAGTYRVNWNAASAKGGLASGVYICSLQVDNFNKSIKLLLTK